MPEIADHLRRVNKHNGRRLYDLAREGIEVERPARQVPFRSSIARQSPPAAARHDVRATSGWAGDTGQATESASGITVNRIGMALCQSRGSPKEGSIHAEIGNLEGIVAAYGRFICTLGLQDSGVNAKWLIN